MEWKAFNIYHKSKRPSVYAPVCCGKRALAMGGEHSPYLNIFLALPILPSSVTPAPAKSFTGYQ